MILFASDWENDAFSYIQIIKLVDKLEYITFFFLRIQASTLCKLVFSPRLPLY